MTNLIKAKAKTLRVSPRKLGLVAALVRGRSVADALVILEHTPKQAAGMLAGVIRSAQANAEHNFSLDPKQLVIATILIGPGFVLKRWRPATGAAHQIRHRSSNVTVILDEAPIANVVSSKKPVERIRNGPKS